MSKHLKYVAKVIMGQSPDSKFYNEKNKGIPFLQGNADFGKLNPSSRIWTQEANKICKENDILLSVRAPVGAVNIADNKYGIGRGLCAIRAISCNQDYLYYYIISINEELNNISTGSTFQAVSVEDVKNINFPEIDNDNQIKIAHFLDQKCARIDELIEKKQKLIELKKEERTALINQAVTKGLDPKVPMKDSGIEWLGEIPEHWKVKRLKYVSMVQPSNVDKKSNEGELSVLLCNYVDVYMNEIIDNSITFMKATANNNEIEKFKLIIDDVLITKDSETPDDIAVPALVKIEKDNLLCGYHLAQIRSNKSDLNGEFLFRLFQSKLFNQYFEVEANGITRFGLGVDSIKNVVITLPPVPEQIAIATHIHRETGRIDAIIEKIQKQIELLKEYKTTLISEAVTGKIIPA